jgi:hypothetical protein
MKAIRTALGLVVLVLVGMFSISVSTGSEKRNSRSFLEAHVRHVFSGISPQDAGQLRADKQRVRDVHAIADLVEKFHKKTGRYPLGTSGDSGVVLRNEKSKHGEPKKDKYNVGMAAFVKDLRSVLGDDIAVPVDRVRVPNDDPMDYMDYAYSLYGGEYAVSAYLYHPVKHAQTFGPHMHQYRVGSTERILNASVLKYSKILEGGYLSEGARD